MSTKNLRRNERIRASSVRLVDENSEQVGIVDTRDALERAKQAELDLVEVSPRAKPPVCRIMDYGKWMYANAKKDRKTKAKRHETELKQIRIRTPKIGDHDLEIKIHLAEKFIERGDRVQFSLRFRGRELAHIEEGQKVFQKIKDSLIETAKVEQDFRREGRRITMLLVPDGKPHPGKPEAKGSQSPPPAQQKPKAGDNSA